MGSGTKTKPGVLHAASAFRIGRGPTNITADNPQGFNGAIDEVFVLNGANTNDVVKLYNYRRAEFDAANAAAVLPEDGAVSVNAGATLLITNSIESVKELCGAGTVYISAGSSLEVRRCGAFTGVITGGGRFLHKATTIIIR